MSRIVFYGASDDLIEIDGDVREEFSAYEPDPGVMLAISDGTLLGVEYDDDGTWRFKLIEAGQGTEYTNIEPATHKGELPPSARGISNDLLSLPDYTDFVHLDNPAAGKFTWVVLGVQSARRYA